MKTVCTTLFSYFVIVIIHISVIILNTRKVENMYERGKKEKKS